MADWREIAVEELAAKSPNALATGPFGSAISSKFFEPSGVPVIRGSNLSDALDPRLIDDNFVFVSPAKASEFGRSVVRRGDLVFTCWGTVGQVGLIDERARYDEYVVSNKQMKLTPNPQVADSLFLYYVFSTPPVSEAIKSQAIGSSVPGFNLSQLRSVRLRLPSIAEQRTIVGVLGALDNKIEQNRRTVRALERLAQAIFRAWFVDFEPVKAKAAGATAFPSMPQPVFDALPTRFVDSAIGPVPDGWEISTVGNCASYLSRGITPRYVEDSGVLVLNQRCIRDFAIDYGKARRHNGSARRIDGREIRVGDVLINSTGVGTLGRLAQVLHVPEPAVADTHVTVVRPGSGISASYFGQALISMQPHIESLGEGSTGQTELNRRKISELTLLVPTTQLMDAYQDLASPLMELVSQTRLEDSRMVDLRDYLLPKLLSGDLRVN